RLLFQQQQADMAAQQERQRLAAIAQQRHEEAERKAAIARAEQAQRQAEADVARREAEARDEAARRTAAQLAAENSPDNYCRSRDFAREILNIFNNMGKSHGVAALDIEHIITTSFDANEHSVSCHGDFMLTGGQRLTGTLSIQPNVAGDILTRWHAD